jgi:CheY-like chemotaxis protein
MRPDHRLPLRVLVVDDWADTRRSLGLLLASWGHEAREAADGAEALRLAGEFRLDVVLLDLAMPGGDGFVVARGLRELELPSRPLLVALTAHSDSGHIKAALEAGFDHFLTKPCGPGPIEFLLRSYTRGPLRTPVRPTAGTAGVPVNGGSSPR